MEPGLWILFGCAVVVVAVCYLAFTAHSHKWEVVARYPGTAERMHLYTQETDQVDVVTVVEKCECGKLRAYMVASTGQPKFLNVEWVRMSMINAGHTVSW